MQQSSPKSVEDHRSTKLPNTGPVDAIGVIGKHIHTHPVRCLKMISYHKLKIDLLF